MLSIIGRCVSDTEVMHPTCNFSQDDISMFPRERHWDLKNEAYATFSSDKGQSSTAFTSTTVYESSTIRAKESSLSLTSIATFGRPAYRQVSSCPEDLRTTPIRFFPRQTFVASFNVRMRLWRIASRLHRSDNIPNQFYEELLELTRENVYPYSTASKAWDLLMAQITPSRIKAIVDVLLTFPDDDIIAFMARLATLYDMQTPWHTSITPRLCLVIQELQRNPHGLNILNTNFNLNSMAALLSDRHQGLPGGMDLSLYRFFDALLSGLSTEIGILSMLKDWDLPPTAERFLQYILTNPEKLSRHYISDVVEHIMSFIQPFAGSPPENYLGVLFVNYPSLRTVDRNKHGVGTFPIIPFLKFASHLAFRSPLAVNLFIDSGMLNIIGRLWLQHLRTSGYQTRYYWTKWHEYDHMSMIYLFVLGALAQHHPSVREYADQLLRLPGAQDGRSPTLPWEWEVIEKVAWNARLAEFSPQVHPPTQDHVAACLSLFLIEVYAANCLDIWSGVPTNSQNCEIGSLVMDLISSKDAMNGGRTDISDAAARILLSYASAPEEYWDSILNSLKYPTFRHARSRLGFEYIIYGFLRAGANDIYADSFTLPSSTLTFLQRLNIAAKLRGSEVTNPIDRFIMMIRQIMTNCPQHVAPLRDAGVQQLLKVVLDGRYDKFFHEDKELPPVPPEDDTDSTLTITDYRSSISSMTTLKEDSITVKRRPLEVRAQVCTQMLRSFKPDKVNLYVEATRSASPVSLSQVSTE